MKKVFSILLLVVILTSSVVMLAGCKKKIAKTTKREITENIEETIANIKSDVVISGRIDGGELMGTITYYVNYNDSKLYVHEVETKVPLKDGPLPVISTTHVSLVEYTLSDDDMKELKEFIESENEKREGAKYTIRKGNQSYQIKESGKFEELMRKIRNV
ncbi:MAG: hypothetical protein IKE91_03745 [Clostridia bacterium]|nr:hypothetical protein [Clostridia bacterium]